MNVGSNPGMPDGKATTFVIELFLQEQFYFINYIKSKSVHRIIFVNKVLKVFDACKLKKKKKKIEKIYYALVRSGANLSWTDTTSTTKYIGERE